MEGLGAQVLAQHGYIRATINRTQIYVTDDDQDDQDDTKNRQIFSGDVAVYEFANRGMCWHDP